MRLPSDEPLLRYAIAAVWLATGLLVLAPGYRAAAAPWLAAGGLPTGVMWATCLAEVALGVRLILGPAPRWMWALQAVMVVGFTGILVVLDAALLVHPLGLLSKNLPFLLVVWVLSKGPDPLPAQTWLLRIAAAAPWFTEGLLPKVFFQDPWELALVPRVGLGGFSPSVVLIVLGVAQALSGVLALALRGRARQAVLVMQAAALVVLPLWVGFLEPAWWVHPFGPFTKNLPILAATLVVVRRC